MFTALFIAKDGSWCFWDFPDEYLHDRPLAILDVRGQFDRVGEPSRRFRVTPDDGIPGEFFPTYVDVRCTESEGEAAVRDWVATAWPKLAAKPRQEWPWSSWSDRPRWQPA